MLPTHKGHQIYCNINSRLDLQLVGKVTILLIKAMMAIRIVERGIILARI
jgi:hypothetical protein